MANVTQYRTAELRQTPILTGGHDLYMCTLISQKRLTSYSSKRIRIEPFKRERVRAFVVKSVCSRRVYSFLSLFDRVLTFWKRCDERGGSVISSPSPAVPVAIIRNRSPRFPIVFGPVETVYFSAKMFELTRRPKERD